MPDGVTVESLKAAVEDSRTVFEVQQALNVSRPETTDFLQRFDLPELVSGRVAGTPVREDLKAEIDQRICEQCDGSQT